MQDLVLIILALFSIAYAPPNPAKCHCGIPHYENYPARIYKGNEADQHSNPWVVLIKLFPSPRYSRYHFGGVILSTHHVLTAASEMRIGRGSYGFIYAGFHYKANLRFDENDTETIKFNQKMVKIHPDYNQNHEPDIDQKFFNYDFALITLDDDERRNNFFKLSPRINPICLPHDKEDFVKKVTNTAVLIKEKGWGKFKGDTETNSLRIAEVKKMDNKKCYKALESKEFDAASLGGADFFSDPYGYCLLGKKQQRMCLRDNGGPAIAKDASHNNRAYLVGIGFWSAMDFRPHKITPEDECDSNRKIPSKYAKITQDVIKWLMFKDYPNKKKPRQEVLDCLVPT